MVMGETGKYSKQCEIMKQELILVGGGGHCKSCIDVIEQDGIFGIAGIIDMPDKLGSEILGYKVIGTDDDLPNLAKEYAMLVTVGHIKSPETRINLFQQLKESGSRLPVIISPLAYVSKHAKVGEGTIVMHHAVINAGAMVGRNCIINTKALVEHDATVEDHCHIATCAVINGGVKVGSGTFFGSGSVSREYIKIGENVVVGCHATIKSDVGSEIILK